MTVTPPTACLRFVQRICLGFQTTSGHDAATLPQLQIHRASPGRIWGTLKVGMHNLNRLGTLHGGCIATLADTMGSLAIASNGLYSTGVSTDIHTTYVQSAGRNGDIIKVSAQVINMGKTLAFTRMEIRHPVTNALLAYGSHTKFIGKALHHPENVAFDHSGTRVVHGKQPHQWETSFKL